MFNVTIKNEVEEEASSVMDEIVEKKEMVLFFNLYNIHYLIILGHSIQ